MARVKYFINGTPKTVLESEVNLQGERSIDQAKFKLPPNVDACPNDCVTYIQDIADVTNLKLFYAYDCSVGDESGFSHHGTGFGNIPAIKSRYEFNGNLTDNGSLSNDLTINMCGTEQYVVAGKIECAFCFDGCTSLTAPNECQYDFMEFNQKWSVAFWFSSTNMCPQVVVGKQDGCGCTGWNVRWNCSGNLALELINTGGTNELEMSYNTCILDGNFHHVVFTYGGTNNPCAVNAIIDGESVCLTTVTNNLTATIRNNIPVVVGDFNTGPCIPFTGQLDDLHIFEKELTTQQAISLYYKGVHTFQEGKWGKSIKFDGCTGHYTVPDNNDFDLCGQFELIWWMKASGSCSTRTVFHKTGGCDTFDFKLNASCNGVFRFGSTTLTSCTDLADCEFHQIRLRRDACCTVSMYVDNVLECSAMCVMCDETSTVCLTFGRNESKAEFYDGEIDSFRWYKGTLSDVDVSNLFNNINPISIMKFGGQVTKVEKEINIKNVTAQSFGKQLAETEVRPTLYSCKSPEFIVHDLIINNTDFISIPICTPSGIEISRYTADGKLFDLVDDMMSLIGATFYTNPLKLFFCQKRRFRKRDNVFTHGVKTKVFETKFDDTELVNELTVVGENKRFQSVQLFSGDGSNTVFCLSEPAVSTRVEHPINTELVAEVDFDVCSLNKTLTIFSAPVCGMCNIQAEYEFEKPLIIRGTKQSSIDEFGVHAKRLILPWISTRNDGVRFIQGYLNRFSDVRTNLRIEHPFLLTSLRENDVIQVINSIKNIDSTFVIKGIKYRYPKFQTELDVGEYTFDDFEYDKQITQKIHDLEGAITTIKELRGYESPEEVLNLCDTVNICVSQCFTECLGMTDVTCVTEIFDATYSCMCTTYSGDDAYV